MMLHALYPGSFDPITNGHLDIIDRAQEFFDVLTVAVSESRNKNYLFSMDERISLIQEVTREWPKVQVVGHKGLTVDLAAQLGSRLLVRGIRAVSDFEAEMNMANANKGLAPQVETVVFFAKPDANFISSRMIKEIVQYGGSVEAFVPALVAQKLSERLKT